MTNTTYRGCPVDDGCTDSTHDSLVCYPRYFELEYEGPGSEERIMTFEAWMDFGPNWVAR